MTTTSTMATRYLTAVGRGVPPTDAAVAAEVRRFEADRGFDAVAWLIAGLDALADQGEGLMVGIPATGPRAPTTWALVVAAFEREAARALEEAETPEEAAEVQAAVDVSRAWVTQEAYGLWRRAMVVEDEAADMARDQALNLALGREGPTLAVHVAETWAAVVGAWVLARRDGRPDVYGADWRQA